MAAPTLNTYEYQYMDSGVLLNGNTSLPFIDVQNVSGLDIPDIDVKDVEYDSRHGGFVYARYVKARTIIIDGILYANPATIDTTLDALNLNYAPRENDDPFYFKNTGIQKYIMCKPIGLHYDVDTLRRYGASKIQIQLRAGDPLKYTNNADVVMTPGNTYTFNNSGTESTYPVFSSVGSYASIDIMHVGTGDTVTITYPTDGDDYTEIDYKNKVAYVNGDNASNTLTSIGWQPIPAMGSAQFRVSVVNGNLMANPGAESSYGSGYAVGSSWTGTQQFTGEKRSGNSSLRMARKNKTAANGNVTVPTGITNLAVGTYNVSVWIKGTMPKISLEVLNNGTSIAKTNLTKNSKKSWKKISVSFTLSSASGVITLRLSDTGDATSNLLKNRTLFMDDFNITSVTGTLSVTAQTKNGWL